MARGERTSCRRKEDEALRQEEINWLKLHVEQMMLSENMVLDIVKRDHAA